MKNITGITFIKKKSPDIETPFAKFALKKIKPLKLKVFDIGCGNGRDTIFLIKKNSMYRSRQIK